MNKAEIISNENHKNDNIIRVFKNDYDYLMAELNEFKNKSNDTIINYYSKKENNGKIVKYKYSSDKMFKINLVFNRNFKDVDNVYYWKLCGINISSERI